MFPLGSFFGDSLFSLFESPYNIIVFAGREGHRPHSFVDAVIQLLQSLHVVLSSFIQFVRRLVHGVFLQFPASGFNLNHVLLHMLLEPLHSFGHDIDLILSQKISQGKLKGIFIQGPDPPRQFSVYKHHIPQKTLVHGNLFILIAERKVIVDSLNPRDGTLPVDIWLAELIEHVAGMAVILGAEKVKGLYSGNVFYKAGRVGHFHLLDHGLNPGVPGIQIDSPGHLHKTPLHDPAVL